ncbi:MAG TPA: GPR endopeptidase, partial [Clostridiales bacterium]|nr:GPR endopeptidase [Clostridiales bacterium]
RLRELAEQVIAKHMGDFIVTPKDIDVIVEDMAGIIANAINSALFGNNLEQVRNMLA